MVGHSFLHKYLKLVRLPTSANICVSVHSPLNVQQYLSLPRILFSAGSSCVSFCVPTVHGQLKRCEKLRPSWVSPEHNDGAHLSPCDCLTPQISIENIWLVFWFTVLAPNHRVTLVKLPGIFPSVCQDCYY